MRLSARIAFAATVVLMTVAVAIPALAQPVQTIDLNAPVKSGTQCMPCHATLGVAKTPGHIFQHGSHMTVSCDTCHWAPSHTGGVTILPSMQACFSCHGVRHGDTEVARGDCSMCHTDPRAKLRPVDHVAGFEGEAHAVPVKADANRCMMCHSAASCDDCHEAKDVETTPAAQGYRPVVPHMPRKPIVNVMPNAPVTIGQCVSCHPDLDRYIPGRVIFAHATHLQKAFACVDCHRSFPHKADVTSRPDMPACYQCHGLQHASLGLVATDKCADCHPKDFALKPADHTASFEKSGHKVLANESPQMCAMCHAPAFCTACHQGKPAKQGGPERPKVIPADHRDAQFKDLHGKNYLAQKGACGSCHDSASCKGCHSTAMPHPADWTSTHPLAQGLDSQDCKVCHTDRQRCAECHHKALRGAQLVQRNCVTCHPQMSTKPATAIKNAGLAEHAAHFVVAERKGKPYRCEQCHVGFGVEPVRAVGSQPQAVLDKGHDLRSCYECHGALDYQNKLVAPYPGNSLCVRCHSNLNL